MFESILQRLTEISLGVHAVEIVLRGETVLHSCPGGDVRYPVYSAAKSVTSAAFSLACDDGLLSPDMPLAGALDSRYQPLMTPQFKAMPFSRFLTMTAGKYPFRPEGDDWIRGILSLGTDYSDTSFNYSNIPAYLVGAAVENAVGGRLIDHLDRRLFEPLGIPEPVYRTSPEGHFYGATGMELTVHELALLGRLYLQKGAWEGRQLISEKAVIEAVTPRVQTGSGDSYGFFFRAADDHFSMVGKWGQRCIVFPGRQLVIAYLSHEPDRPEQLYRAVLEYVSQDKKVFR